MTLVPP
jgi:ribosome-associated toxin RatA of RatAB toxin-antitoxin module